MEHFSLKSYTWLTRKQISDRRAIGPDTRGNAVKRLALVVAVLFLSSCGLRHGPINKPPVPTGIAKPSRVTVSRVSSFTGWPVPMIFTINSVEIYGLWSGQSYSFMLEPGDYIFGYYLGFGECRRYIRIENKPSQHIHLAPACKITPAS